MPNLLLLLILSFFCLPGFSQEDNALQPISPQGGRVIIRGATEAPVEPQAEPIQNTDNSDVAELEAIRAAQQKKIQMVEASVEPLAKPLLNPIEEMKKLGYEQVSAAALWDDRVLEILQRTLKERPASSLSEEQLRALILESKVGSVLAKFPRVLNFAVNFVRDEKALPGLLGILSRKDDLKSYGYIWLVIFIFGLFIKSRVIKPKWAFKKRFIYSISFSLFLSSASLFIFYSLFSEELKPTLSLIF